MKLGLTIVNIAYIPLAVKYEVCTQCLLYTYISLSYKPWFHKSVLTYLCPAFSLFSYFCFTPRPFSLNFVFVSVYSPSILFALWFLKFFTHTPFYLFDVFFSASLALHTLCLIFVSCLLTLL